MSALNKLNSTLTGVYQISGNTNDVENAAQATDLTLFTINAESIKNTQDLFYEFASVLNFPEYFGQNWDALHECLTDLSWMPFKGIVLLVKHSKHLYDTKPDDFKKMIQVLLLVTHHWQSQNIAFFVFIHDHSDWNSDLPKWLSPRI